MYDEIENNIHNRWYMSIKKKRIQILINIRTSMESQKPTVALNARVVEEIDKLLKLDHITPIIETKTKRSE